MFRKVTYIIAMLAVFGLFFQTVSGQSNQGKKYRIAVLPFYTDISPDESADIIRGLNRAFETSSFVTPLPYANVTQAFQAKRVSETDCADAECARNIGYTIRSNFVVHGKISTTYSGYLIELQTTHVKSGKILARVNENFSGDVQDLVINTPALADKLVNNRNRSVANGRSGNSRSSTVRMGSNNKGGNAKWAVLGLLLAGGVSAAVIATQGGDDGGDGGNGGDDPPVNTQLPNPPPLSGGN